MLTWILGVLVGVLAVATLLPLSRKSVWWVRGADFPRLEFAVFGTGLVVALLVFVSGIAAWTLAGIAAACVLYQAWWIIPYTPMFPREVKAAAKGRTFDHIRVLSANVLMTNQRVNDLLRIIEVETPDLVVTLETNRWWEQALKPLEASHPHTLKCPLENFYGMHLFSRLPFEDAKIQFLVEADVPSMHLLLVLPSGRKIRMHFLHPAPPSPTENPTSKERDAELVMVGRSVARSKQPIVVSGDLNDVAWSATTRLFRKISGLLDPRIGRGMYNTFHAKIPFMRWPVDHFFHSRHFTLVRLARLPACGSDHFPVLIELALDDAAVHRQDSLPADAEDHSEAQEKMERENVSSAEVHCPGERPLVTHDDAKRKESAAHKNR